MKKWKIQISFCKLKDEKVIKKTFRNIWTDDGRAKQVRLPSSLTARLLVFFSYVIRHLVDTFKLPKWVPQSARRASYQTNNSSSKNYITPKLMSIDLKWILRYA